MSNRDTPPQGEPFLFLEPNKTFIPRPRAPGGFPPEYYHTDEEAPSLEAEIETTIDKIESKNLGDESTYYLIDFRISKNHNLAYRILRKLNANVLSEINETQILVTSSLTDLKEAKSDILRYKTYRDNIFTLRNLRVEDIIDSELNITDDEYTEPKTLTIHLVPNIGISKAETYVSQLSEYLEKIMTNMESYWIDSETGDAIINTILNKVQLIDLINNSDFLFKIHEKIKIQTTEPTEVTRPSHDIRIHEMSQEELESLPTVCLLDSGVNPISELSNYIIDLRMIPPITTLDDNKDHGTSVASLAILGDSLHQEGAEIVPKVKIISYKILDREVQASIPDSLEKSILENPDCRTYSCSLGFTSTKLGYRLITQKVHNIAQRSNRCVVFSAGNISPRELKEILEGGIRYPRYLPEAPVYHPSDALSVLSIGSITKNDSQNSIAPANAPSPFTRFGTIFRDLLECPKPELVEHGGNLCFSDGRFSCNGIGVTTFDNNGILKEDIGTSYSTPIISQYLARIWEHFKDKISNVETIKAIILSTCILTPNHPRYVGFGVPDENKLFYTPWGTLKFVFEGTLKLRDYVEGSEIIPTDEVKVFVPGEIQTIELFLNHSDNYRMRAFPSLNTYLKVITEKPGKQGSVKPYFGHPSSRTHVKKLVYNYKRNIKGNWYFKILPVSIGIPRSEQDTVVVRYGGVINLISKRPRFGLAESVIAGLSRGERTQISLLDFKTSIQSAAFT